MPLPAGRPALAGDVHGGPLASPSKGPGASPTGSSADRSMGGVAQRARSTGAPSGAGKPATPGAAQSASSKTVPGQPARAHAPGGQRGAPVGHPPGPRPAPDHLDQTIAVPPPARCPHCQCVDLPPVPETLEHGPEDIVITPATQVICLTHQQAWCPGCERTLIQAAPGERLGSAIGPVAKATTVYLR